jgi:hypothetical protein
MDNRWKFGSVVAALLAMPVVAQAGQLKLWGVADGTTKYSEVFSNSFY